MPHDIRDEVMDFVNRWRKKQRIINYYRHHPLEGYRRLTFMMLDEDVVAVSPSSTYRVLSKAGLLRKWNGKCYSRIIADAVQIGLIPVFANAGGWIRNDFQMSYGLRIRAITYEYDVGPCMTREDRKGHGKPRTYAAAHDFLPRRCRVSIQGLSTQPRLRGGHLCTRPRTNEWMGGVSTTARNPWR